MQTRMVAQSKSPNSRQLKHTIPRWLHASVCVIASQFVGHVRKRSPTAVTS